MATNQPTPTPTASSTNNVVGIGTVLPGLADNDADIATIKLLHEVEAMRRQLRALEPQLSKAITEFGLRRGWRGYREFYLCNELNQKQYVEK
jgi:glycine/D-amino acid oxidase-like deaminating enzyme